MAAISFSLSNAADSIDVLTTGSQRVTEGTSAPGVGDLEIRIADLSTSKWTKEQLREAFDTVWRFIDNANNSTTVPL